MEHKAQSNRLQSIVVNALAVLAFGGLFILVLYIVPTT